MQTTSESTRIEWRTRHHLRLDPKALRIAMKAVQGHAPKENCHSIPRFELVPKFELSQIALIKFFVECRLRNS